MKVGFNDPSTVILLFVWLSDGELGTTVWRRADQFSKDFKYSWCSLKGTYKSKLSSTDHSAQLSKYLKTWNPCKQSQISFIEQCLSLYSSKNVHHLTRASNMERYPLCSTCMRGFTGQIGFVTFELDRHEVSEEYVLQWKQIRHAVDFRQFCIQIFKSNSKTTRHQPYGNVQLLNIRFVG